MSSPFDSPEHVSSKCAYVDLGVRAAFGVEVPPDRACLMRPEDHEDDPSIICGAIVRLSGIEIAPGATVRVPIIDDEDQEPCKVLSYLEDQYRQTGGQSQHPSMFLNDAIRHAELYGYPPHVPPPEQR